MKIDRSHLIPPLLIAGYLGLIHWIMGIRTEHWLLVGFLTLCYYLHPLYPKARRFVVDFLPLALFGTLYDFLRLIPKEFAGPIHVVWPYRLESLLFGFSFEGKKIIPNEFFITHHHAFLDLLTGLTYSLHVLIPIGFAFYCWLKNREQASRFIWTFFLVNVMAFITYIALPVAPPWYVEQYGLTPANWSVPASSAGLAHFDRIIGFPYFEGFYAKSSWVFGAVPSMHAGFPLLVILFARKVLKKRTMALLYLFMSLVWFSAVYLRHHYIIDLLAGAGYVMIAFFVAKRFQKTH